MAFGRMAAAAPGTAVDIHQPVFSLAVNYRMNPLSRLQGFLAQGARVLFFFGFIIFPGRSRGESSFSDQENLQQQSHKGGEQENGGQNFPNHEEIPFLSLFTADIFI